MTTTVTAAVTVTFPERGGLVTLLLLPKDYLYRQRENGGHRARVHLPFFLVSAWRRLRSLQESTSQDPIYSSSPALLAEKSGIAVTAAFCAVTLGSARFPGYHPFSSGSTTILGSAKRPWFLGRRCLRHVAKDGTKISGLGGEPIPTAFPHV